MTELDVVVVGAGVIGLAIARQLACSGRQVAIIESEWKFGQITSSRNSEVIHAGIYYPKGSLKAKLCVQGKQWLYDYCKQHDVPHDRMGKLIVAVTDEQVKTLEKIQAQARENGVDDLEFLDSSQVKKLEPHVRSAGALLSPSTGVVDSHSFMEALIREAEAHDAMVLYKHSFQSAELTGEQVRLTLQDPSGESFEASCRLLINAAGLNAPSVAREMQGFPTDRIPKQYLAKGSYFRLSGPTPFSRLIYPVPEPGYLGIHSRVDLARGTWFGPDHEPVTECNYDVDDRRAERFYGAIRRYFPDLPDGSLSPQYCGIRPQLYAPGMPVADFWIEGPKQHGARGVVQLFGIESPGLTASLAIARYVQEMAEQ